MTRALLTLFAAVLGIIALIGCGDDDEDDTPTMALSTATTTKQPESTATPAATATPAGSGVKVVDDVIAAVRAKDAAKLTAMVHFWPRPCTEPQGIGALPCPAGSPLGTPVMVIHSGQCEGSFLKPGDPEIATATQRFATLSGEFYAVVKAPPFYGDTTVPGKYQVVFEPGISVSLDDQGITSFSFQCSDSSAQEYIARGRFGPNPEYLVKP